MSDQGFVRQRPRQAGRRSPCGDAEIQALSQPLARLRVATEPNVESARLSLSRSNEDSLLCACRKTASRSSANCSRLLTSVRLYSCVVPRPTALYAEGENTRKSLSRRKLPTTSASSGGTGPKLDTLGT